MGCPIAFGKSACPALIFRDRLWTCQVFGQVRRCRACLGFKILRSKTATQTLGKGRMQMRAQLGGEDDFPVTGPILHSVFFAHSVRDKRLSIVSLVCCMSGPSARYTWKCLEISRAESKLLTSRIPSSTHGMVWSLSGHLELLHVMRMLHLDRKLCSRSLKSQCQLGSSVKALKNGNHPPSHSVKFSTHGNHGPFNFVKQRTLRTMILAPSEILTWRPFVHRIHRSEWWKSIQPATCQGW